MITNQLKTSITSRMSLLEIRTAHGNQFIQTSEILYIKAVNKHSIIFFKDLRQIETTKPLKWYHEQLPKPVFFRCHNSFIVNCLYFNYLCACELILVNNVRISLSRYKKEVFKNNLKCLYEITHLSEIKLVN
jgi:hypothetical protein